MPRSTGSNKRQYCCNGRELEKKLLLCTRNGNLDCVRYLVEIRQVSVHCKCEHSGMTPLMWAVFWNHAELLQYLLEHGADASINATDYEGETALVTLATHQRLPVALAELLLEYGANAEVEFYYYGNEISLLAFVISGRNIGMVRLLLRYGANTMATLCAGKMQTALYTACNYIDRGDGDNSNRPMEIVQLLLDHDDGATVNDFCPRNDYWPAMSPLCAACRDNRLELVQLLVQYGARVVYDGIFPDVPCPLKHAVEKGSLELVQCLLTSPQFAALGSNNFDGGDEAHHPMSLPLEAALMGSKVEMAQLLVNHGANVNDGDEPFLCKCVRAGKNESARFLLRNGAHVMNQSNAQGETPLWIAAFCGNIELMKILLKAGADMNARDDCGGETPLGVAYRQGNKGAVYLLLRAGPCTWSKLRGLC